MLRSEAIMLLKIVMGTTGGPCYANAENFDDTWPPENHNACDKCPFDKRHGDCLDYTDAEIEHIVDNLVAYHSGRGIVIE